MSGRSLRALRRVALVAAGAAMGVAAVAAVVVVAAAAGGVLTAPPGAWVTAVRAAPGVTLRVSVPGLASFATSPLGLRLLDGRRIATGAGLLHFARDDGALLVWCAPCRVDSTQLSSLPVRIGRARLRLAREAANVLAGELWAGDVSLHFTARLRPDRVDVDWQLPPTAVADAYRLLGSVIPEAYLARIDGTISARGSLRLPQRRAHVTVALDGLAVDGLGTEALADGPIAFACRSADGVALPRKVVPGEGRWISPTQSGALLAAAVLAAEDQRFFAHEGIDREEIAQVLSSIDGEAPARGASTITQQLARGLFTGGARTAVRKLRELLYAIEMERTLGKRAILALYLNTVDWGPGICGADAAARTYFGKRPYQLTPLEAAWLAGILRNPAPAYARQFEAGAPDADRAIGVLQQMRTLPRRERERWARQPLAFAEPPGARESAPRLAAVESSGRGCALCLSCHRQAVLLGGLRPHGFARGRAAERFRRRVVRIAALRSQATAFASLRGIENFKMALGDGHRELQRAR